MTSHFFESLVEEFDAIIDTIPVDFTEPSETKVWWSDVTNFRDKLCDRTGIPDDLKEYPYAVYHPEKPLAKFKSYKQALEYQKEQNQIQRGHMARRRYQR